MTEAALDEGVRTRRVAEACQRWVDSLIDLGGRNNLLYYRDLKVGTLTLDAAAPQPLSRLHAGQQVKLSQLFPPELASTPPVKNARAIRNKIQELDEERGIRAGYLATGMASWRDPEGRRNPNAPVVLRAVALEPTGGAQEDFTLALAEEVEINPVLLHLLRTQFGVDIDADELALLVELGAAFNPVPVFDALTKACRDVEQFVIADRTVIGTFSYAKLPMVNDLQTNPELLTDSDVVAAIAGDTEAARSIRGTVGEADSENLDRIPPQDEFLVLDADSSQSRAINSVVGGKNLVIKGPPGTGKSQTIANLISTLVARGQKVLFVAEKRAAIDAVLHRLEHVGLSELVMDLHDGAANRRRIAESLTRTLEQTGRVPLPDNVQLHDRLTRTRATLTAHDAIVNGQLEPWGVTVFEAQAASLATPAELRATTRFRGQVLEGLASVNPDHVRASLREYAQLGRLEPVGKSGWAGAAIMTPQQAEQALTATSRIASQSLPAARAQLNTVLDETNLRPPGTLAEWESAFALLDGVQATLTRLRPEAFVADLPRLCAATGPRAYRKQQHFKLGFFERRRTEKDARTLWVQPGKPTRSELHAALLEIIRLRDTWAIHNSDGAPPHLPTNLDRAHADYATLTGDLQELGAHLAARTLLDQDAHQLDLQLRHLIDDVATLQRLPRLNELRRWLAGCGLDQLMSELTSMRVAPERVATVFDDAWHRSIVEHVGLTVPSYGAFNGDAHNNVGRDFEQADLEHLATTPQRVQRAAAEELIAALNAHDDQARLIRAEAGKRSRHLPLRALWKRAPDVLLAAKPCWAMSPLVVSQVLPARKDFDVVIFDEASQVQPADAIPSIMRARRTVVAGDEWQLPPTSFFAAALTDEDDPEAIATEEGTLEIALTAGYESILDVLSVLMPWSALTWHYRSRDERLIAFSNAHIYNFSLVTFPGVAGETCLSLAHVPQDAGSPGQEDSVAAEAFHVADLVLEHAETRPEESLGVITMGINHRNRIDDEVRRRLHDRPDLNMFFDEDQEERFFVKNLERVQGDERDAIILSVRYGKGPDGRLRYRWGPLNMKGGERRLNVAVTRAKSRMTVVSSFTASDVDPNAVRAEGAKLLRGYLEFAASGGASLGSGLSVPPELNPFEINVRDRLRLAGIPLVAQYGVSGYRIDFAAAHPERPGQMVLAIEADGATYHSSDSARDRDRLRQQHLENLGWTFHRIWSTDWFRDPDSEVAQAHLAYVKAVAHTAHPEQPVRPRPRTAQSQTYAAPTRGPRPNVHPGGSINDYSPPQIRSLVRWVKGDGLLRTDEEILIEIMTELGFQKRGSRIRAAIEAAILNER